MIRCVNEVCQYPDCHDRTCGMTDEELLEYLAKSLRHANFELRIAKDTVRAEISRVQRALCRPEPAYKPACPLMEVDCIHDPAYMREYHKEYWIEEGMPTECWYCTPECDCMTVQDREDFNDGFCPFYDDEDK